MKQVFEVVAVETNEKGELKGFIGSGVTLIIADDAEKAKIRWAADNGSVFSTQEVTLLARPFVKTM